MTTRIITLRAGTRTLIAAAVASIALTACGGGGSSPSGSTTSGASSASGSTSNAQTSTTDNVSPAQYAAGSVQFAMFQNLNNYRQQCGFNTLTENTTLDQAATNHASYDAANGVVSDTETSGNTGFTGVTYADRAAKLGFPASPTSGTDFVSGVSGGSAWTNAVAPAQWYGDTAVGAYLGGVYHIVVAVWPVTEIGVGIEQVTANGFPQVWDSLSIANIQPTFYAGPKTFPCDGVTGVPYEELGEVPPAPNMAGGASGTPVAVVGNIGETIVLQTGTMTDTSGHVIPLQLLDSANDPNKQLPAFEGVAYPASALQPNTSYTVNITGADNGTAFSRTFTFTTGNMAG